ncbi:hypothetical protein Snoj_28930 [Streptomyces nojiriensis]|uniref:Uncharacterized protein n=1 Tax=Streptomyces nojiriensis TaxID=66374 RepID=A0ABQ3SLF8_9ACTN|nr:hypothetical protein [Streptomyces nojiriensis]QTI42570.1 hypothetical protein JYK04_00328 [Streptomyces nojiriensis]GGS37762.1 hypothetical protein GCM10010205_79550 [Streptomyces nojiriensis]GHI68975.1 hypothetical protein Snoj_28930 [Streptomyces nojiriensis]
MKKRLVLAGSALVASLGMGVSAVPALAAQIDVTIGCSANGFQDLIDAINAANGNSGGTIKLAKHCAYQFENSVDGTNALPPITSDIKIIGNGSTLIRSARGTEFRILRVEEGGSLTLKDLTVTGGYLNVNPSEADGGGIANEGTLRLERVTVSGNQVSGDGGGISNEGGNITLVDSHVLTNVAFSDPASGEAGDGGGISNNAAGTLTVKKSAIVGNTAQEDGGGIQNHGTLTVEGTLFQKNVARDDDGAAINQLGNARIKDSKFIENWAGLDGGAINSDPTDTNTTEITGSSFYRNRAGKWGGALNNEGTATLKKSTIKDNQAGRRGGGINNEEESAADPVVLTLEHTTVTENRAAEAGGGIYNWVGAEVILNKSKIVKNLPDNCAGDPVPGCSSNSDHAKAKAAKRS